MSNTEEKSLRELAEALRTAAKPAHVVGFEAESDPDPEHEEAWHALRDACTSARIIAELDAERAAGRAESRWQPIETVPNAFVMLFDPEYRVFMGRAKDYPSATHWQLIPGAPT